MFEPEKKDKFSFGVWTVGNPGADPFGPAVRARISPVETVAKLSQIGAWGVAFHDDDVIPKGAVGPERERAVGDFKKAMKEHDIAPAMASCNLFSHPVFRDGAFTSPDREVRRFTLKKNMAAIDLAVELGAKIYVFWGGREGSESDAGKDAMEAMKRYREGLNYLCNYVKDRKYDLKFAIEAKPNEPRGDIYLPTTASALAFIETLDHSEMVGVNPETAHETMVGLNFYHSVAQALEMGKLFHIDLNAQKIGRYDQDLRFGSEDIKAAFYVVKLLEDSGYDGPRHFDAHAYRTEDSEGVWHFAAGCMRTYKMLQHKAKLFAQDKEIQSLLRKQDPTPGYTSEGAEKLKQTSFDVESLAQRGAGYERLDQLLTDLLLGLRG